MLGLSVWSDTTSSQISIRQNVVGGTDPSQVSVKDQWKSSGWVVGQPNFGATDQGVCLT
jgi:hypothetical protein